MTKRNRVAQPVVNIVIVHSAAIIREGLARMMAHGLAQKIDREVTVIALDTPNSASNTILLRCPDIAIYQQDFPGLPLENMLATIERHDLNVRMIAFDHDWSNNQIGKILGGQLVGALCLDDSLGAIYDTVEACLEARAVTQERIGRVLTKIKPKRKQTERRVPGVTAREVQVLQCIADGKSIKSTADCLGVSMSTVKNIRHALYAKLNVPNGGAAVSYGKSANLIQ